MRTLLLRRDSSVRCGPTPVPTTMVAVLMWSSRVEANKPQSSVKVAPAREGQVAMPVNVIAKPWPRLTSTATTWQSPSSV